MIRIVLSALMALAPAAALAQVSVTDALAREQQIRDAIGAGPLPAPRAREGEAETPPGETGVFVLRRVDIFSFEAGIGGGMTTNAGKSDIDGRDSAYATAYADIGVDTRLGGAVDAGAHLTVSSIRYENASDLDSSSVVGAFTLGDDVWNGLYLQGNLVLGQSFDDDTSGDGTFLASSLVLSRRFTLQERVSALPFVFSSGQTADDSELRNLSLGGGLRLDVLAAPGLVVSPSVSYAWVTYPDFYEDVTFVEREDNRFYIGASAQYAITDVFLVSGSVGYTANDSTLDLSEYESFDASALLRATIRF
jgi:hypothetical protein